MGTPMDWEEDKQELQRVAERLNVNVTEALIMSPMQTARGRDIIEYVELRMQNIGQYIKVAIK